jgi:hypothetical protein
VSVHAFVPLHVLVRHSVEVHVMPVPVHDPVPHVSPYVQSFPSLHAAAARHCHTVPTFVQWYAVPPQLVVAHSVWLASLHSAVLPPPHVPLAPFAPQFWHPRPVVMTVVPHASAHAPATVEQPDTPLHVAVQHWFPTPTVHAVPLALHVHAVHAPSPLHVLVQLAG